MLNLTRTPNTAGFSAHLPPNGGSNPPLVDPGPAPDLGIQASMPPSLAGAQAGPARPPLTFGQKARMFTRALAGKPGEREEQPRQEEAPPPMDTHKIGSAMEIEQAPPNEARQQLIQQLSFRPIGTRDENEPRPIGI